MGSDVTNVILDLWNLAVLASLLLDHHIPGAHTREDEVLSNISNSGIHT